MNHTGKQIMNMMKRRLAYATFEQTVIDLYERKTLTLDLLDQIAGQYRLVSIDDAGSRYLRARDGKDARQICIELVDPTFPVVAREASGDNEEYWEEELKEWEKIVRLRWHWQAYCSAFPQQGQQKIAA